MANEYGIGYWGQNAWNENSDVNITVTGQQLSSANGSVSLTTEINSGWGRVAWGEQDWGTTGISQTVALTGSQVNLSLGNESIDVSVTPILSGQQLNWTVGTVDPEPDESLVGQQLNLNLGSPFIQADANLTLTGNGLVIAQGDESIDNITFASITGIGLATQNPGSVVVGGIANVPVSGNQINVEEGVVDPGPDVVLPSVQANLSLGTAVLDANTLVDVTGQQLGLNTGTLTFTISGNVQLTGNRLNLSLGNENIQSWQFVDTGTTVAYTEVSIGSSVTWNEVDTAA
jgi:hypothetical protein